jgi:hypothetical protein
MEVSSCKHALLIAILDLEGFVSILRAEQTQRVVIALEYHSTLGYHS